MALTIGDVAPDFRADTTDGPIHFYTWLSDSWCVLFSHPKDFTPVCTTELGAMARLMPQFRERGVKVMGISVDPTESHLRWLDDIAEVTGWKPTYPLISDSHLRIARLFGMLPADASAEVPRNAMDNATVRCVFVIGPDRKIKLTLTYPMSTGRDFAEILRAIDSLQLTARHKVATPADWRRGDDVIILPSVSEEQARTDFPQGWRAPKPYLRIVAQPS